MLLSTPISSLTFNSRDLLEFFVLKFLEKTAYTGIELLKKLEDTKITVKPGTLYPLLSSLCKEKITVQQYAESDGSPNAKLHYHVTMKGLDRLKESKRKWQDISYIMNKIMRSSRQN